MDGARRCWIDPTSAASLWWSVPVKPSAVIDTRVIFCGDNLEQLGKLPAECVELSYIGPPLNSNRNYEGPSRTGIFEARRRRRSFQDSHESTPPSSITCARAENSSEFQKLREGK